jgi:hypothetical protein
MYVQWARTNAKIAPMAHLANEANDVVASPACCGESVVAVDALKLELLFTVIGVLNVDYNPVER